MTHAESFDPGRPVEPTRKLEQPVGQPPEATGFFDLGREPSNQPRGRCEGLARTDGVTSIERSIGGHLLHPGPHDVEQLACR